MLKKEKNNTVFGRQLSLLSPDSEEKTTECREGRESLGSLTIRMSVILVVPLASARLYLLLFRRAKYAEDGTLPEVIAVTNLSKNRTGDSKEEAKINLIKDIWLAQRV